MTESQNEKKYDLEERTFNFAKRVIEFVATIEKNLSNIEIAKQLIRSSGSVGANYIEANEAFSKKDFVLRIKICRKEAKESCYWLKLISCSKDTERERTALLQESTELMKIFGAILTKSQ
jgi:four helix bundle protein